MSTLRYTGAFLDAQNLSALRTWRAFDTAGLRHAEFCGVAYGNNQDWAKSASTIDNWLKWYRANGVSMVCCAAPLCLGTQQADPLNPGKTTMTPTVTLAQVASGSQDAAIRPYYQAVARYNPRAIIRPGWEMNGNWYPWRYDRFGTAEEYREVFEHHCELAYDVSPDFQMLWCANGSTAGASNPNLAFPNPAKIRLVGIDIYDWNGSPTDPQDRWKKTKEGAYCLDWIVGLGRQHNKPVCLPEWGLVLPPHASGFQDDHHWVGQMLRYIKRHIYSEQYFNFNNAAVANHLITDRSLTPRAAQVYVATRNALRF